VPKPISVRLKTLRGLYGERDQEKVSSGKNEKSFKEFEGDKTNAHTE